MQKTLEVDSDLWWDKTPSREAWTAFWRCLSLHWLYIKRMRRRFPTCAVRRDVSVPKHSWSFAKLGLFIYNILYITTSLMFTPICSEVVAKSLLRWEKPMSTVTVCSMEFASSFVKAQKEMCKNLATTTLRNISDCFIHAIFHYCCSHYLSTSLLLLCF